MASNKDILLYNNDLLIQSGDLATGISDEQHIADIINAFPGWWKENLKVGVGILAYLNSSGREQEISRKIKIQLIADGYQVTNPSITYDNAGKMIINPNAIKL